MRAQCSSRFLRNIGLFFFLFLKDIDVIFQAEAEIYAVVDAYLHETADFASAISPSSPKAGGLHGGIPSPFPSGGGVDIQSSLFASSPLAGDDKFARSKIIRSPQMTGNVSSVSSQIGATTCPTLQSKCDVPSSQSRNHTSAPTRRPSPPSSAFSGKSGASADKRACASRGTVMACPLCAGGGLGGGRELAKHFLRLHSQIYLAGENRNQIRRAVPVR